MLNKFFIVKYDCDKILFGICFPPLSRVQQQRANKLTFHERTAPCLAFRQAAND